MNPLRSIGVATIDRVMVRHHQGGQEEVEEGVARGPDRADEPDPGGVWKRQDDPQRQQLPVRQVHPHPLQHAGQGGRVRHRDVHPGEGAHYLSAGE